MTYCAVSILGGSGVPHVSLYTVAINYLNCVLYLLDDGA